MPVDATVASAAPIGVAAAADDAVETGSLAINMATGSFTITNPSNSYATRWASTQTEPKVEVDCGVNNMDVKNSDDNTIMAYVGGKNSCDYVLSVSKGWVITGYSFDVALVNAAKPVMLVAGENTVQATTTPERVTVNGLCENNFVGFTLYGDNNAVLITNWTISYKTDPNAAPALDLREKKVFENVAGGVPYRIPAIGKAGNGDIIAVADSRPSHADIGSGRVDLHLRRSTDNGKTWAAVHALDLHALLFGILFRGQYQRHGQTVHRQHRRHREQQQPRLHRVGQGGVIQIAEQHDRHEIAEGQLVQGRHGVDADGAQTFGTVAQRHDEKQGRYGVEADLQTGEHGAGTSGG